MRRLFIAILTAVLLAGGVGADCSGGGSPNASGVPGY